jgi:hypothetical protein
MRLISRRTSRSSALRARSALVTLAAGALVAAVAVWRKRAAAAGATDLPVGEVPPYPPAAPTPAAADPSPANPETDLPAAPQDSAGLELDGPNESAPGHEIPDSPASGETEAEGDAGAPNEGAAGHEPAAAKK